MSTVEFDRTHFQHIRCTLNAELRFTETADRRGFFLFFRENPRRFGEVWLRVFIAE